MSVRWDTENLVRAARRARDDDNFALALRLDDAMEESGGHSDDRVTCWTCQTWATQEHLANDPHHFIGFSRG